MSEVVERYHAALAAIAAAEKSGGRTSGSVRLLPVSKTVSAEIIRELYDAGERRFGENRVPVLEAKAAALPRDIQWDYIGPLQSNKVRKVVKIASRIHSVDNLELLERLERIAGEENRRPEILIEVSISGEASKGGCTPDDAELLVRRAAACKNLQLIGFMTMAPLEADDTERRRVFSGLRDLRDRIQKNTKTALPELSMGMSGDFEQAIAGGATIVRIGSSIFKF